MSAPLIIHHANCPDGFGAAWLLGKFLGEHEKCAASYGGDPPYDRMEDRDAWIVDFCYPGDKLREIIANTTGLVLILDHHQSAAGYVADVPGLVVHDSFEAMGAAAAPGRCHAIIDQSHSGIGIVAQWVHGPYGIPEIPQFLYNLEDRDLWKFRFAETPAVFAAVTSFPYTDEAWDKIAEMGIWDLVREGEAIERYRQQLVQQCVDLAYQRDFVVFVGATEKGSPRWDGIWVANAPYAICSDVAGELAKRDPERFAATFFIDDQGPKWSLRSTDEGMDVAEVAALMQPGIGGGHKHAAGFRGVW
jgi:hypothetical protein